MNRSKKRRQGVRLATDTVRSGDFFRSFGSTFDSLGVIIDGTGVKGCSLVKLEANSTSGCS